LRHDSQTGSRARSGSHLLVREIVLGDSSLFKDKIRDGRALDIAVKRLRGLESYRADG